MQTLACNETLAETKDSSCGFNVLCCETRRHACTITIFNCEPNFHICRRPALIGDPRSWSPKGTPAALRSVLITLPTPKQLPA